jgi:hypothetical protein
MPQSIANTRKTASPNGLTVSLIWLKIAILTK